MRKCFFFILLSVTYLFISCNRNTKLFELIPAAKSGIEFENKIVEHDSINPIDLTNIYNGGGIGVGDFNNDGLQDLYFTGNQVANRLYINKGDFKFQDVTDVSSVGGNGEWCRGVTVIDINNDGWQDIYVSATILKDPNKRKNLLYINQGVDKEGIPHFKEMAKEYGLDDTTQSTMAAFFDYDNDGDLDMYLAVNAIEKGNNPGVFRPKIKDGSFSSTGRLYRNDWDSTLNHPVFKDVTKEAGVTIEGYGHSVNIADFNRDGWKDILVTNDFNSNDLLYINNHDGTFTDKAAVYFKHTSANGMGADVVDINNDGLDDIVELDMNPEDNYRKKTMMGANSYQTFQNSDYFGYQYQYVRNTLQLNQGNRVTQNDSIGDPIFSDVSFYAGIAQTDWSWTPVVADFDNDGNRDIIISNGFPKDITDHDFIAFRRESSTLASLQYVLSQIPQVKINNYAFRNNGDLTFTNNTAAWGFEMPSFSNGAVYADLDNDGDLDLIVNNINDPAFLYRNTLNDSKQHKQHYLTVQLKGDKKNINGIGSWIEIYYSGKKQVYEASPYRGYLSSMDNRPHFGLGTDSKIDSVVITWPDNKEQVLKNISADQILQLDIKNADRIHDWSRPVFAANTLFKEVTDSIKLAYKNQGKDFIDFNIQSLLPHKFSEYGPALAVGDVNGDGLDDIVTGESASFSASILLQQKNGGFIEKNLMPDTLAKSKTSDDEGIALFDADGDGDLDIFIAGGGFQDKPNSPSYQDRLFINDGKGNFSLDTTALPKNFTSKSCVRVVDFDNDGDLDLFIGGRVDPHNYPQPVSCFIYRNDSKNGQVKFTDVTSTVAKELTNIGMVCDAVWTDFDNDGWQDLILAGEWMPLTFLKNDKGILKNVSASSGINDQRGWWNSIVAGDFDNDGKTDYIVGNLGENSFYKASDKYPARVYGKDMDSNGIYDMIPSLYLPDTKGELKEFPAFGRDDLLKQVNAMRKKFPTYKSYADATMDEVLNEKERKGALILQANNFNSCLLHNEGNGRFSLKALPPQAQFSAINGMVVDDFDGDGNLDVAVNGNDYSTEVSVGRYDASNGLVLLGDGKGNFKPLTILESGVFIPGNGKSLVKLKGSNGKCLIAASQNRDKTKIFELKKNVSFVQLKPLDVTAIINYKNGKKQIRELGYGSSFMSQSGRFLNIDNTVSSIAIKDSKGNERLISFK
jgi:hypothetical protein